MVDSLNSLYFVYVVNNQSRVAVNPLVPHFEWLSACVVVALFTELIPTVIVIF